MSLRDHRDGRSKRHRLVRTRNRQPDVVRKAGPHIKALEHEPLVCGNCNGLGNVASVTCPECQGEGEV